MKPTVVVLYGGKSPEHEISQRSAKFVLKNINRTKYNVVSVGIDKLGQWWPQDTAKNLKTTERSIAITTDRPIIAHHGQVAITDPVKRIFLDIICQLDSSIKNQSSSLDHVIVFPVIHGAFGEDGKLQGLLEMAEIAFVGCSALASGIGMDKVIAKKLAASAGVPIVPYFETRAQTWATANDEILKNIKSTFGFPVFVKPARLGSSVGISKADSEASFLAAMALAFQYDDKVLIEKALRVKELECAALGGYTPKLSLVGEVIAHDQFYTYDAKYVSQTGASIAVPAHITQDVSDTIRAYAQKIYQALDLYGMARIDFFLDQNTQEIFFNEVNTIPGFTDISQYPMLWRESGLDSGQLIDELLQAAVDRRNSDIKLLRTI